jgi:hypothetical protein
VGFYDDLRPAALSPGDLQIRRFAEDDPVWTDGLADNP